MTSEKKQNFTSQASLFNKEKAQKSSGPINLDKLDRPDKTIRIAVSGDVILTKLEMRIIDTESFQRLRKYRQLGTSYLIYPSAHHTRFEHSLGVLEVANRMIALIKSNEHSEDPQRVITDKQKRIARLAALLHDISNIPFGHTLEDETNVVRTNQEDKERLLFWIGEDKEIGKILIDSLGQEEYDLLVAVLTAKNDPESENKRRDDVVYISDLKENAFIVDLIKNTVCADLLDYLARDTYFCGLPLSIPDRFMRYLYLNVDLKDVKRVAIRLWKQKDNRPRAALISELIQLLEIRYFLAERVYFHHAKEISSAMIAAAVWYAQHQDSNTLSTKKLKKLGDDELLKELRNKKKYPIAYRLAERLTNRNLYKRFYSISRARIDADRLHDHLAFLKQSYHKDANNRARLEQLLSDYAGLEKGDALIYCPNPDMNLKIARMFVTSRQEGDIEEFRNTDDRLVKQKMDSIIESHRNLWELQVFVNPRVLQSEHKKQILYHWCQVFFEPPQSEYQIQSNERIALSSVIEDLWRNSDLKSDQFIKDKIVAEALSQMRNGPMNKETLVSIMERHMSESPTKK